MRVTDKIDLAGHLDELARINDWIDRLMRTSQVDPQLALDLKLCVNEAITNIISYGFTHAAIPQLSIEVALSDRCARAVIEDNGDYFDLRAWPDPSKPKDINSVSIGGFGIPLIKERASRIEYSRVADRNRLTLICRNGRHSI